MKEQLVRGIYLFSKHESEYIENPQTHRPEIATSPWKFCTLQEGYMYELYPLYFVDTQQIDPRRVSYDLLVAKKTDYGKHLPQSLPLQEVETELMRQLLLDIQRDLLEVRDENGRLIHYRLLRNMTNFLCPRLSFLRPDALFLTAEFLERSSLALCTLNSN